MSQRLKYESSVYRENHRKSKRRPTKASSSYIYNIICDDNLMRNGCMECFFGVRLFAGGHTVPSRYGCVFNFILLINANKKDALLKRLLPILFKFHRIHNNFQIIAEVVVCFIFVDFSVGNSVE